MTFTDGYRLTNLKFSYEPGQCCPTCNGPMRWIGPDQPEFQYCRDCGDLVNVDTGEVWEKPTGVRWPGKDEE